MLAAFCISGFSLSLVFSVLLWLHSHCPCHSIVNFGRICLWFDSQIWTRFLPILFTADQIAVCCCMKCCFIIFWGLDQFHVVDSVVTLNLIHPAFWAIITLFGENKSCLDVIAHSCKNVVKSNLISWELTSEVLIFSSRGALEFVTLLLFCRVGFSSLSSVICPFWQ